MVNKKPNLEFVNPKDIQHDNKVWHDVLVSKVVTLRDAKGKPTYAYLVSNMYSDQRGDLVVGDGKMGPAVQEFFKGGRTYFLTRGDRNEIVAVGRGKNVLRVDGNIVIAKKAKPTKPSLDFFKESEIEHDNTFIDDDVIVFSLEDPKQHKIVAYSALTHQGEFFIPVADGPETQSFLDGSCFILENKGKIVAIGKGHRYLKVDGKNIIPRSIRERYKRISKTKKFKDAYVGKSIGETIKIDESKVDHQIVINNKLDPVTTLYDPNGKLIGKIRNNAAWSDVCAQIHTKRLDGYYVMFKGEKIIISKNGGVKNVPPGFYDSCDGSLDILLDLN